MGKTVYGLRKSFSQIHTLFCEITLPSDSTPEELTDVVEMVRFTQEHKTKVAKVNRIME